MAAHLTGKVVVVFGSGGDAHRGVALALAQSGADVAVAGVVAEPVEEARLHSIANEIWALGKRSTVTTLPSDDAVSFAAAVSSVTDVLGSADLVVRCEAVMNA
jgi:NAD(P)-dependent dehydrogenase (short-subunit alcohol dehydrogenase family)